MNALRRFAIQMAALACLLVTAHASADSLPAPFLTSDEPLSTLGFVRGSSLTSWTVMTASAGTVTVKLADLTWPQAFGNLQFSLSNSTSQLLTSTGSGSWSWEISSASLLYASVYAVASGAKNIGVYALDVTFVPALGVSESPVPLPTAVWMLLSGMGVLLAARRKHTAVTQAVVHCA